MALSAWVLQPAVQAAGVSDADLVKAEPNRSDRIIYGRTYDNQRFSPLKQITPGNVGQLRPVWAMSLGTLDGLEATPLIHGGVMYVTSAYANVFAIDARNGRVLWKFMPEQPEGLGAVLCCGPVNRGVAIYGDLIYVLTLDARLVALRKDSSAVAWTRVLGDWEAGVSATGAPYVVKGMVIAAIAGGEYAVRGYIKAFDAASGAPRWTTYTVPGAGEAGNDSWPRETWKVGGGATWQSGACDAELNLLYWGTGNPGPRSLSDLG